MTPVVRTVLLSCALALTCVSRADAQRARVDTATVESRPPAPPFAIDAARIAEDSLVYEVVVMTDSATMPVGTHTVTIAASRFATTPAWAVAEHRTSQAPFVERTAIDTVLLSRESLAPLRWEGQAAGARFVAAFAGDTVYGATTAGETRGSSRATVPGQPITTEAALDLMLRAAPLAPGWAADAPLLVADVDTIRVVPLHAWVEREARLDLGSGERDVWVVRVTAGAGERLLWVDRETQRVLRAATTAPHMPGMSYERVLLPPS